MVSSSRKFRLLYVAVPLILVLVFFSLTSRTFRRAPWYKEVLWNMISPPQMAASAVGSAVSGVWNHYIALVGIQKENVVLKQKIALLEAGEVRISEIEKENERLRGLLAYHDTFPKKISVARVISSDMRAEFKSITINRGAMEGIEPLMPVLGPKGLVGKVGETGTHTARVLLITDPNSAVDVLVQRSRARAMIVGTVWHTTLKSGYYLTRMEYLNNSSDIQDGDTVVTSGLDGIFPPGIPVGTVHDLKLSQYGIFREAGVVPFEDMAELQDVAVVLSKAEISSK